MKSKLGAVGLCVVTCVVAGAQSAHAADWIVGGNNLAALGKLGTTSASNYPIEIMVHGERALRIEPGTVPNMIGGFWGNGVTSGVIGATIAGGGNPWNTNVVADDHGFIGGGSFNQAGDNIGTTTDATFAVVGGGTGNFATAEFAVIGGGNSNQASGAMAAVLGGYGNVAAGDGATAGGGGGNQANGYVTTIAGGYLNVADGYTTFIGGGESNSTGSLSDYAVITGGKDNVASGDYASVLGGWGNHATGSNAATLGGGGNQAGGNYSVASGFYSNADFNGCFVFSDTSSGSGGVSCGAVNRFVARAAGGVFFYSNSGATAGVKLNSGANAWSSVSDRNAKKDFKPVDAEDVLKRVAAMPMTTWTYKSEPGVRHMGPMAQDFRAAFELGTDDKSIVTIDADGVALAAVQGLNKKVTRLEGENAELKRRLDRLEAGGARALIGFMPGSFGMAVVGLGVAGAFLLGRRRGTQD